MTTTNSGYGGDVYAVERERRASCAVWLAAQCAGWSASCICRPITPRRGPAAMEPPAQRQESDSNPEQHDGPDINERG